MRLGVRRQRRPARPRPGQQAPRFTANGYSFGYALADRQSTDDQKNQKHWQKLEAPPGFEPGVEVLQTSALPLGDGASVGGRMTRNVRSDTTFCALRIRGVLCHGSAELGVCATVVQRF